LELREAALFLLFATSGGFGMQAVVLEQFGSYENGRLVEIEQPLPKTGEILIEVRAAPVNYVDLVVAAGKYQFAPPLPYTPGKGPAGFVAALGPHVTGFAVGERVLGMAETGGYAQFARVSQSDCYHIPDKLSFSQAGAMSLAYDTAWFALRDRARLAKGETVLILGATGAVGKACSQLGRAMGATIIAAVSSPARADAAFEAGASSIVDLSVPDLHENLRRQVFAVTDGKGVDVVIDMLGGDVCDAAMRAVAWRGRFVVVGFATGRIPTLKMNYLMLKNIEASGLQVSDYRKRRPDMMADCYREIFSFYEAGLIDPGGVVEFPLSEFKTAMSMVDKRETIDRVILVPQRVV
jgi:NADPH2:quinone reductase